MDMEDIQGEIEDTSSLVGDAMQHLENAESCESLQDLEENLRGAISSLGLAQKELEVLAKMAGNLHAQ